MNRDELLKLAKKAGAIFVWSAVLGGNIRVSYEALKTATKPGKIHKCSNHPEHQWPYRDVLYIG
jgi:hypothetical protein